MLLFCCRKTARDYTAYKTLELENKLAFTLLLLSIHIPSSIIHCLFHSLFDEYKCRENRKFHLPLKREIFTLHVFTIIIKNPWRSCAISMLSFRLLCAVTLFSIGAFALPANDAKEATQADEVFIAP